MAETKILSVTIRISAQNVGTPLQIFNPDFEPQFLIVNGQKQRFTHSIKFPQAGEYTLEIGLRSDATILGCTVQDVVVTAYSLPDGIEKLFSSFRGWEFACPIQIPSTVNQIGHVYCHALSPMTVVIPEGVTHISQVGIEGDVDLYLPSTIEAISYLEVKRLHIPATNAWVSNLEKCQDVTVDPGGRLVAKDGWIIDSADDSVLRFPRELLRERRLVIPDFFKHLGVLAKNGPRWQEIVVPKDTVGFENWQHARPYNGNLTVYFEAETLNESQQGFLGALIRASKSTSDSAFYNDERVSQSTLVYVGGVQVWPDADMIELEEQRRQELARHRREQAQREMLKKLKEIAASLKGQTAEKMREMQRAAAVSVAFEGVTKLVTCKWNTTNGFLNAEMFDHGPQARFTINEKQLNEEIAAARTVYDAISPVFEKYAKPITDLPILFNHKGYRRYVPRIIMFVTETNLSNANGNWWCEPIEVEITIADKLISREDYHQFCSFVTELRQAVEQLAKQSDTYYPKFEIAY